MIKLFYLVLCLSTLVLSSCCFCNNNYYVSSTGSNTNDGSAIQPFQTLQFALDLVSNASCIYVTSGVHSVSATTNIHYSVEVPQGGSASISSFVISQGESYWTGFTFLDTAWVSSATVYISDSVFEGISMYGIKADLSILSVRNCLFLNNGGGIRTFKSNAYVQDSNFIGSKFLPAFAGIDSDTSLELANPVSFSDRVYRIDGCTFTNNSNSLFECPWSNRLASCGGGAIYIRGGTLYVANSDFLNNGVSYNTTVWQGKTPLVTPKVGGGAIQGTLMRYASFTNISMIDSFVNTPVTGVPGIQAAAGIIMALGTIVDVDFSNVTFDGCRSLSNREALRVELRGPDPQSPALDGNLTMDSVTIKNIVASVAFVHFGYLSAPAPFNTIYVRRSVFEKMTEIAGSFTAIFNFIGITNLVLTDTQIRDMNVRLLHYPSNRFHNLTATNVEFANITSTDTTATFDTFPVNDYVFLQNVTYRSLSGNVIASFAAKFITMIDCRFVANRVSGAVVQSSVALAMNNTVFDSNHGPQILQITNGITIIQDSIFTSNIATGSGGALYMTNDDFEVVPVLEVRGSSFFNNEGALGGAIFVENPVRQQQLNGSMRLYVTDSIFSENRATIGGALYTQEMDFLSERNTWQRNSATEKGGAIMLRNYMDPAFVAQIHGDRFISNKATGAGTSSGGSVILETFEDASKENMTTLVIAHSSFIGSSAARGADIMQTSTFNTLLGDPTTIIYDSCTFSESTATGAGGSIYASEGFYTNILRSTFDTIKASTGGLYQTESRVDISDTTFSNAVAQIEGGAIYMLISKVNFTAGVWQNVTFTGNRATYTQGGAASISLGDGTELNVTNCHFIGNSASFYGGAISAARSSKLTFVESSFINNRAFQGGALHLDVEANFTISGCNFESNEAADSGGAIAMLRNAVTKLEFSTFKSNAADTQGGAIYATAQSVAQFDNCDFFLNGKDGALGGAISISTTTPGYPAFTDCKLKNNTALNGGATYIFGTSSPVFKDCAFGSNIATGDGGAIYTTAGSTAVFNECGFDNNVAAVRGGALRTNSQVAGFPRIQNGTFNNNFAQTGGALFVQSPSPQFLTCIFNNNMAETDGGAATVSLAAAPHFESAIWNNNQAAGFGGALHCEGVASPNIVNNQFIANNATSGGGVSSRGNCRVRINRSTFIDNNAEEFGGSLYHLSDVMNVRDTVFTDSTANFGGAVMLGSGIDSEHNDVSFYGNSFSYCHANSAGGVVYWDFGSGTKSLSKIEPICQACIINIATITTDGYGQINATRAYQQKFANWDGIPIAVSNNQFGPVLIRIFDYYDQYATANYEELNSAARLVTNDGEIFGSTTDIVSNGEFRFDTININGYFGAKHTIEFAISTGDVPPIFLNVTINKCTMGQEAYNVSNYPFCRECSVGLYNFNANGTCLPCPANAICGGGNTLTAINNYWSTVENGVAYMYQCPPGFCENGGCAEHRSGTLCGDCGEGFQDLNGACIECESSDPASLFGTVLLLWLYVSFLQMTNREPGNDDTSKKKYAVSGLTKVIVFYIQTAAIIGTPHEAVRRLFSFLTFQFFLGIAGKCSLKVTFFENFLVDVLIPVVLFAMLAFNFVLHSIIHRIVIRIKGDIGAKLKMVFDMDHNLYYKTLCALLLFSYTSVTQAVFTFKNCRPVGNEDVINVVASAPMVSCDSDEYARWDILANLLLALYIVLLPVALFFFLTYNYLKGNLHLDKYAARLGVLFMCFKDKFFYWDVVILIRRLIYVVISVEAFQFPEIQTLTLFSFSFFILVIQVLFQPFKSKLENRIETGLLSCLVMIAGIEASTAKTSHQSDISIFSSIITFLAAIPILFGLYRLLFDFLYRIGLISTSTTSKISKMFGVSISSDEWSPRKINP